MKLSFSISFRRSVFVEVGPFTLHMSEAPSGSPRWGYQRPPAGAEGELWVAGWYVVWAWGEEERKPSPQWRPLPTE